MESKAVCFCVVVGVLGIISAIVGFVGEATRVKGSKIRSIIFDDGSNLSYCSSSIRPSLLLAIIGIVFAIITQIYISITFVGCKYFRHDPNSTTKSKLFLILSWIATVVAVVQFSRAVSESKPGGYADSHGDLHCYIQPGIFAVGAIFALFSAIFGIAAYVTVSGAPQTTTNPPAVGIPVGANIDPERNPVPYPHPQYPPPPHPQYPPPPNPQYPPPY